MKIEPKFEVNNLVQHKYEKSLTMESGETACAYEVMEINTNTCYAGTQIFYELRPIHKIFLSAGYGEKKKTVIDISPVNCKTANGFLRYREDELVPAKQEDIDLILGK